MAKLILRLENTRIKEIPLEKDLITVGRKADNDIFIGDQAVSNYHARLIRDPDGYSIEDLNSRNGTFVNKQRVARAPLYNKDVILIGMHALEVVAEPRKRVETTPEQDEGFISLIKDAAQEGRFHEVSLNDLKLIYRHCFELVGKRPYDSDLANAVITFREEIDRRMETIRGDRFISYFNGTVLDRKTGLMWAANDNGHDISFAGAVKYCRECRLGGHADWRSPTMDELEELYKGCAYPHVVSITKKAVWAGEKSAGAANIFNFQTGEREHGRESNSKIARALPVRNAP